MSDKLAMLTRLLEGEPRGFGRDELAKRLRVSDREARLLISELTTLGALPIVCTRDGGEGRYRIAQPHEWDAVNAECSEDASRAISLHNRAKGRRKAFEKRYSTGDLFLRAVPELEATA
jgi:hypothetical protein